MSTIFKENFIVNNNLLYVNLIVIFLIGQYENLLVFLVSASHTYTIL